MRIALIRHGETLWNREHRYQGQVQVALSPRGWEQARKAAQTLALFGPNALYTSPLRRALETAQAIGEVTGLLPCHLDGLMEINLGELEGLTSVEFRTRYPELREQWVNDASNVVMPGGESLLQLQERAWESVQEIVRKHLDDGLVVAVSHGFTIRTILYRLLGIPLSSLRAFQVDYGSLTILEFRDDYQRVVTVNSPNHLCAGAWEGDI